MATLLRLFTLLFLPAVTLATLEVKGLSEYSEALNAMKALIACQRTLRGEQPLTYDTDLESFAQAWALEMAGGACTGMEHSTSQLRSDSSETGTEEKVGENLYISYSTSGFTAKIDASKKSENRWTDECKDYNGDYQSSPPVGHFTQEVWKDTSRFGCAICVNHVTNKYYTGVVCEYAQAGNFLGQFGNKVPPIAKASNRDPNAAWCIKDSVKTQCFNEKLAEIQNGGGTPPAGSPTGSPTGGSTPTPPPNPCSPNPCKHGGTCSNNGGAAQCACTSQYTGSKCATLKNTGAVCQKDQTAYNVKDVTSSCNGFVMNGAWEPVASGDGSLKYCNNYPMFERTVSSYRFFAAVTYDVYQKKDMWTVRRYDSNNPYPCSAQGGPYYAKGTPAARANFNRQFEAANFDCWCGSSWGPCGDTTTPATDCSPPQKSSMVEADNLLGAGAESSNASHTTIVVALGATIAVATVLVVLVGVLLRRARSISGEATNTLLETEEQL